MCLDNSGILVAGGSCRINRQCPFVFTAVSGCCNTDIDIHQNEDFFAGQLSSVEFFNLQTSTWSQLGNMQHTRGNIGLAIINNRVTSFSTQVYNVTQEDYYYYFTYDTKTVPMFYEELDDQYQWRNVSYPTKPKPETFLTFPIKEDICI